MSYDLYVNETYIGPLAGSWLWEKFLAWSETLDVNDYEQVVQLCEYTYVDKLAPLRKQLEKLLENDDVPYRLIPVTRTISEATKKLGAEPEDQSILWITDGANRLEQSLLPAEADDGAEFESDE